MSEEKARELVSDLEEQTLEYIYQFVERNHLFRFLRERYDIQTKALPSQLLSRLEEVFKGTHKASTKPINPYNLLGLWNSGLAEQAFYDEKYLFNIRKIDSGVRRCLYDLSVIVPRFDEWVERIEDSQREAKELESMRETEDQYRIRMGLFERAMQNMREEAAKKKAAEDEWGSMYMPQYQNQPHPGNSW
jgi:hypothetical protein